MVIPGEVRKQQLRKQQKRKQSEANIMNTEIYWTEALQPLIQKYKDRKHPLNYENMYQLIVMLNLVAQDSDTNVNRLAPAFFTGFKNMEELAKATPNDLYPFIMKLRNFGIKTKWLIEVSQRIKTDKNIPLTMDELVRLPGIGRKAANIIIREPK